MLSVLNRLVYILFVLICTLCVPAVANEGTANGFVALSSADINDNNYYDLHGDNPGLMTEVGVNGRYNFGDNVVLAGQVIYRDVGDIHKSGVRLDYASVDISLFSTEQSEYHLLIGRVKNNFGLYTSTLDVPLSRPSIILPQSIYANAVRDLLIASDGVKFSSSHTFDDSELEFTLLYGELDLGKDFTRSLVIEEETSYDDDEYFHIGGKYHFAGSWLAGLDYVKIDIHHSVSTGFQEGDLALERNHAYFRYSAEQWEISMEYMLQTVETQNLYPVNVVSLIQFANAARISDIQLNEKRYTRGDSLYFIYRYLLTPSVTLTIGYDYSYVDRNDRDGSEYQFNSGQLALLSQSIAQIGPDFNVTPGNDYENYQKTAMFGVSWQAHKYWQLMAEYHNIHGASLLPPLVNKNAANTNEKYSDIFVVRLSYRF